MRTRGRRLWPSSPQERRILMALGGVPLRVPRGVSPYLIARRLTRAAAAEHPDIVFVRDVLNQRKPRTTCYVAAADTSRNVRTPGDAGAVAE
jgi:hypothetical protein